MRATLVMGLCWTQSSPGARSSRADVLPSSDHSLSLGRGSPTCQRSANRHRKRLEASNRTPLPHQDLGPNRFPALRMKPVQLLVLWRKQVSSSPDPNTCTFPKKRLSRNGTQLAMALKYADGSIFETLLCSGLSLGQSNWLANLVILHEVQSLPPSSSRSR